jgi:hypothetical protein
MPREGDSAARSLLNELRDIVAVPRPHFDERQDEKLGAPFFQLASGANDSHIWD